MNRIQTTLLLIILSPNFLRAQFSSPDNDPDPTRWIRYEQPYYKIPVAQNGLYRIMTAELDRAGLPTNQIDPTTIQLFHRGTEQAIYVAGESDHRLDSTDFIEFYGNANDGATDSLLYRPNRAQPHSYYSLFSDTTAYFLTWHTGATGKRMTTSADTDSRDLTPEPYHWADELRLFTDTYPGWAAGLPHKVEYSYYEAGEGYTGAVQSAGMPHTLTFQLENSIRIGPPPQIDLLLVGRTFGSHRISCLVGPTLIGRRLLDSARFVGYVTRRVQQSIFWSDVGTNGQLNLTTVSQADANDAYSVSYVRLRYPQRCMGTGQPMQLFQLAPNKAGRSLLIIDKVLPDTRFWDISDLTTPQRIPHKTLSTGSTQIVVPNTEKAHTILAVTQPRTISFIQPIAFTDWHNRSPSYLIISHESLLKPVSNSDSTNAVRDYARYRASPAGGKHDTLTATMQQLFDQYSYGERHPLAIRRFARQMLQQANGTPPYLLLLGRGRSTPGIRNNPQQAMLDLVMTAGFPGSDVTFTTGLLTGQPDVPALPTGRVSAGTPQDILAYLAKVKDYERGYSDVRWRKNWLHLSGGQTPNERDLFHRIVDSYRDQVLAATAGINVTTIDKATNAPRVDAPRVDTPIKSTNLAGLINEGVGVLTFFGHSGLDATDIDIGLCSDDALRYHNRGKYPVLLLNGCALGNGFYGRPTIATDWVLTPNRGAIAAIAQSHIGYVDALNTYTNTFYNLLTDSTLWNKSLGQLQQETIRRVLAQNSGGRTLANVQQMVLQGDPALRLFPTKNLNKAINVDSLLSSSTLTDFTVSPNPFCDRVTFTFTLTGAQSPALVTITLIDLTGRVVRHLHSPTQMGRNESVWDGRSDSGSPLSAGVYLYTLRITNAPGAPVEVPVSEHLSGRLVLLR